LHPVETYFKSLHDIRSTGGAVPETSYYPALANLLDAVGADLRPKVRCVSQVANTGAGSPDFGLFADQQFRRSGETRRRGETQANAPQPPERGVVEVKPTSDDSWVTADGKQVSKYWGHYRQVLVTNYRDFVFLGQDDRARQRKLETFRLADSESSFWARCAHPRKFADETGERLVEYLRRVMLNAAPLADPQEVAWFLASYAREAKARVEMARDLPGLAALREALESSLGIRFAAESLKPKDREKGEHFFRATLVQTLFYGIFSSWVLWARENGGKKGARFNWHEAAWNLHVPMIAGLFDQIATPNKLKPLGLDEVLDWTGMVLNRVEHEAFSASSRRSTPSSTSTSRSWRPTTRSSARTSASGTPRPRSSSTRLPASTRFSAKSSTSPTAWPTPTSTSWTPAAAPGRTSWRPCERSTKRSKPKAAGR
jgi:hypothetical protein